MTEQTNMEGAQPQGTGQPNPASQGSGQQPSAGTTGEVSLQEIQKELAELRKERQSAKDREFANLRKEFEAKFAELSGKPVVEEKPEAAVAPPSPGTTGATQAIPEVLARFTEHGLSAVDPDVANLIASAGTFQNKDALLLATERLINRKLVKPAVSAGAVISPAAPPPVEPAGEELTREYINKVTANRGNRDLIRALKAEYAKKGVAVDSIRFSV